MDGNNVKAAKQKRATRLAVLTRIRRRAFVLIDAKGSRTQLGDILKELDDALSTISDANHEYTALVKDPEEEVKATKYMEEVESQYEEATERIHQHLLSRKDEPPSVASSKHSSRVSKGSAVSSKSRDAEIDARIKEFKLKQLQKQLIQEKELKALQQKREKDEQEAQQHLRLQEAQDEVEVAKLEANLRKSAEDDLSWERKDDFVDGEVHDEHEKSTTAEINVEDSGKVTGKSCFKTHTSGVDGSSQQCKTHQSSDPGSSYLFRQSLPKLHLPTFSGNVEEWPKWGSLYSAVVDEQPISDNEKMLHLQNTITGPAKNIIGGMLFDDSSYQDAIEALKDRY